MGFKELDQKYIAHSYARFDLEAVSGKGRSEEHTSELQSPWN